MVMSCSENAVIIRAIVAVVLVSADCSRWCSATAGSAVRAVARRLSISAAISAGSAISAVMWFQTIWSR